MSKEKYPLDENDLKNYVGHLADTLLEIEKIETKLSSIIKRNSIVDIAAKVEVYQLMLDRSFQTYAELKKEVEDISAQLKMNHDLPYDRRTIQSIRKKMLTLPNTFADADKRFGQVKANCEHFIADILK